MKCCDIHAGMLRNRITIERRTTTADGYGGTTESWAADPATPITAYFKALSGTEVYAAQRIAPRSRFRCIIRFRGDVSRNPYYTPNDRLVFRGRYYNILNVVDVEMRNRWIELLLNEGAPS